MSNASIVSLWSKTLICGAIKLPSSSTHRRPGFYSGSVLHLKPAVYLVHPFLNRRRRRRRQNSSFCSTGQAAGGEIDPPGNRNIQDKSKEGFLWKWKMDTAEMSSRAAKLGLAAILAYGLFDGVTYTTFFVLAFLGYEKSTGKNPAANLQALLGIVILMWTGNNVTRPFRVAGAAALAPAIDRQLMRFQKYFKLPSQFGAFLLVAGIVAASCLTIVGLLIFSRWGK